MKPIDFARLLLLAALWGGSYLFMRIAAPVLGVFLTIGLRVTLAAATLGIYALQHPNYLIGVHAGGSFSSWERRTMSSRFCSLPARSWI